jgi:2,5-diamino-6-(ribosylamino)-4(3H)-pyrimidinone 5'-phosphate reductase
MTLDGKIATRTRDSPISSLKDLKVLHRLRSINDAVMIGVGTLIHDDPCLTVRLIRGPSPIRVIVDGSARTPVHSRIFGEGPQVIVAVTKQASKEGVGRLKRAGAQVIRVGSTHVDLKSLLFHLHSLGIKRVLLEGGGTLNWSMISEGLVDRIAVTVAPIIIGGRQATTLVDGEGVDKVAHAISLTLTMARRRSDEVILTYNVRRSKNCRNWEKTCAQA